MDDERRLELANKLARIIVDDGKVLTTVYDRDDGSDRVLVDYVEVNESRLRLVIEEFLIVQGLEEA